VSDLAGSPRWHPPRSELGVHEDPDDLRSDPDGKSGARGACGVIIRAG